MLNLKDKELFDTKISLINNKEFRDAFIKSQASDINEWDVGLVALWNTPVLFYELKKAYPNKKFYYIETKELKDIYGVAADEAIYIDSEEELYTVMYQFRNPKLIVNPPYKIGGKIIAKCKQEFPKAKYSILMPIYQYQATVQMSKTDKHKLLEYINDINKSGTGYSSGAINNPEYSQAIIVLPKVNLDFFRKAYKVV